MTSHSDPNPGDPNRSDPNRSDPNPGDPYDTVARGATVDALTRVFVCCDRRDWSGLGNLLGDTVAVDYTSLNGGEPGTVRRDDLVAAWRGGLSGFDATQHLLGSFLVDTVTGAAATLRCYAIATHVLHAAGDRPIWTVAGHYDAELRRAGTGWQLTALTLHVDWITGNTDLPALAAARATTAG